MSSCAAQNAFNLKAFKSDALTGLVATRTEWEATGGRGLLIAVLWFGLSFWRCLLCRGDLFVKYALSRDSPPVWGTAANISGRATALACDKGDQDSLEKALWMAMLAHAVPRRDGLLLPIYNFHLCSVSFCPTEKCLEFTELAVQWTCDAPRRWIRRRRTRAEITWTTC